MIKRRDLLRAGLRGALPLTAVHCAHRLAPPRHAGSGSATGASSEHPTDPEALIRLLEDTARDRVVDALAAKIRKGLGPDELVAALFAAGTRNVLTGREFGAEQHILLCVHSVHRASSLMPARLRWRPLLWAADFFKEAQETVAEYEPHPMQPLSDRGVPEPRRALRAFEEAMDAFDGARAEAAIADLHRSAPRHLVIETLLRHGSRDFRHIGHKAIHVSNGLATLDAVEWRGAEEALRSMASTMALHYEEAGRDPDRSWVSNQKLVTRMRDDWTSGRPSDDAVRSLLTTLRRGEPDAASTEVVRWSSLGVAPRALWDAMLLSSAELLFNNPQSVEALHAVTASNAAYVAFERARDDANRRLLLLQNAARIADFHDYVAYRAVRRQTSPMFAVEIDQLEPAPVPASAEQAVKEVFAGIGQSPDERMKATKLTLGLLESGSKTAGQMLVRGLEIISDRATDSHDFKLAAAVADDLERLSPQWRARYLVACIVRFKGSTEPTTALARQCEALGF